MVVVVVVTTLFAVGLRDKSSQQVATYVVVFTEGARWRTGRWADAIVADDKGSGPRLFLELGEGRGMERVTRDALSR